MAWQLHCDLVEHDDLLVALRQGGTSAPPHESQANELRKARGQITELRATQTQLEGMIRKATELLNADSSSATAERAELERTRHELAELKAQHAALQVGRRLPHATRCQAVHHSKPCAVASHAL